MALYSIRLDEAGEQTLSAVARSRKVTRAVILREAIAEYGKTAGRTVSVAQQFSSLIGAIDNGPGNLSERTGEAFASIVAAKRSGREKTARALPKKSNRNPRKVK